MSLMRGGLADTIPITAELPVQVVSQQLARAMATTIDTLLGRAFVREVMGES